MKFIKKPVIVKAIRFTGDNNVEICAFDSRIRLSPAECFAEVKTLEGIMKVCKGDWIIKGVNGEVYPCKPDIFKKTYEEAP